MSSPQNSGKDSDSENRHKRPGHGPERPSHPGRHGSSWVAKLHRRHDQKHHTPREEEQRPLLTDDYPAEEDEHDEEAQAAPQSPPSVKGRLLKFWQNLKDKVVLGSLLTFNAGHNAVRNTKNFGVRSAGAAHRNWKATLFYLWLLVILLVAAALIPFMFGKKHRKTGLCTTPACVHAASSLLYNLDPSHAKIDPCTDFDKLACGGFQLRHDLRPDQGDMFTGTLMVENSQTILRHILEGNADDIAATDKAIFKKLKDDYDACMDEKTIRSYGVKPLKGVVDKLKMLYPVPVSGRSSTANAHAQHAVGLRSEDTLGAAMLYKITLGIGGLLSIGVGADDKEPEKQVIFANPTSRIGLPSKQYYDDKFLVEEYESIIKDVLGNFFEEAPPGNTSFAYAGHYRPSENGYGSPAKIDLPSIAKAIVTFEKKMATITPDEEYLNDITKVYNPMSLSNASAMIPELSLREVVTGLSPRGYDADKIIVGSPSYLSGLSELLKLQSRSDLQGYLAWKAVQTFANKVEDPAVEPYKRFVKRLQGQDPDATEERWRTCINTADSEVGWILSKFFVDAAFSPASKKFGDQIVSDIKDSFQKFIKKASWMDESVQERAIKKVHAIDQKIGYPTSNPDIMSPKALEKYYTDMVIANNTFFENAVQAELFDTQLEWSKLGKPTRHDEWGMTVPTVNAYYNPAGNEIVFPAGIMQSPVFYDPSVPQYLSYGAFGAVAGHELSHAFDNSGSQYDETGKYADWWTNNTRVAFENKTSCFIKQYSEFTVPGPNDKPLHVNGKLTLGENVADAGGIHAAFNAWKLREKKKPSKTLPGLEKFTKEQLFFINYANWWCGKTTKAKAIQRIYADPHAPKNARILGTMANSADFRKAFKCPSKKPTCDLW